MFAAASVRIDSSDSTVQSLAKYKYNRDLFISNTALSFSVIICLQS